MTNNTDDELNRALEKYMREMNIDHAVIYQVQDIVHQHTEQAVREAAKPHASHIQDLMDTDRVVLRYYKGKRRIAIDTHTATSFDAYVAWLAQLTTNPKDDISLCNGCYCMTHTINNKCGKCGEPKGEES